MKILLLLIYILFLILPANVFAGYTTSAQGMERIVESALVLGFMGGIISAIAWIVSKIKSMTTKNKRTSEGNDTQPHNIHTIVAVDLKEQIKDTPRPQAKTSEESDLLVILGLQYLRGEGVDQDIAKALEYFQKAADTGNAEAKLHLEMGYYIRGETQEKRKKEAWDWLMLAAVKGDSTAQSFIAAQYEQGNGVPQNHTNASYWYQKAKNFQPADEQKEEVKTQPNFAQPPPLGCRPLIAFAAAVMALLFLIFSLTGKL